MLESFEKLAALAAIAGGGIGCPASKEVTEAFASLENLKKGEALRYRGNGPIKFLKKGDTLYVYTVLANPVVIGVEEGHQLSRKDFTALLEKGENREHLLEFAFDSRYFERVAG